MKPDADWVSAAKNAVRTLTQEAVFLAVAKGAPLHELRGTAFFDTARDGPVLSLNSFNGAKQAVAAIPTLITRFGAEEATRVVLQWVYEYFGRVDGVRYDENIFEALWSDFIAEVEEPNWMTRGVANVRNFDSQNLLLDLDDGVTLRGRTPADLTSLGFSTAIWERLAEDWSGPGASSFVLVAEEAIPKQPEKLIFLETGTVWTKAMRAIGALRLAEAGSISIGPMWVVRAARFNVGIGGIHRVGASIPANGSRYVWSERIGQAYPSIYRELAQLEKDGYGRSPGNLDIALRAFMATYDRWPPGQDSQLLDLVTALEAVLGTETEISFKLAFRLAALLAASDEERGSLLKTFKDFYDTRSTLVHGGKLKEKHQRCLARIDELRSLVRKLLRAFVGFAVRPPAGYHRRFFREELDVALVNGGEREKLRRALGF